MLPCFYYEGNDLFFERKTYRTTDNEVIPHISSNNGLWQQLQSMQTVLLSAFFGCPGIKRVVHPA